MPEPSANVKHSTKKIRSCYGRHVSAVPFEKVQRLVDAHLKKSRPERLDLFIENAGVRAAVAASTLLAIEATLIERARGSGPTTKMLRELASDLEDAALRAGAVLPQIEIPGAGSA